MARRRVVLGFGTRPEAIKLAPVHAALSKLGAIEPLLLATGQHQEQLDQALSVFGITATTNLRVMTDRQQLPELVQRILPEAARYLRELGAEYVLVQGDTLSTFTIAWAAFLERIPFGHVEAGLRSHDLGEPFPEEACRSLTGVLADLHFAPTPLARDNLLREGKDPERILVTGQTGVDAVLYAASRGNFPTIHREGPYVTVTLHRREHWPLLDGLARALAETARDHPRHTFVFPAHRNPIVREAVLPVLSDIPNFVLMEPLDYGAMAALLAGSVLIVTDSGGLQEEGTTLGVPVLVVRAVTERPEGVESGSLRLVGTEPARMREAITEMLAGTPSRRTPDIMGNPYGDGCAAERVAAGVAWRLGSGSRPADWRPRLTVSQDQRNFTATDQAEAPGFSPDGRSALSAGT